MRAEGPWLFDVDGRRFLDANSSWWVAALGHNHPRLVAALAAPGGAQLPQRARRHDARAGGRARRGALPRRARGPRARLLQRRRLDRRRGRAEARAPVLAPERAPGAPRFVALDGAFHGETLGVTAIGGVEAFRAPVRRRARRAAPHPRRRADGADARGRGARTRCSRARQTRSRRSWSSRSCRAPPGMRVYGPGVPARRARALRPHDVLLVADEVFTGYGRTRPDVGVRARGGRPGSALHREGLHRGHAADGRDARDASASSARSGAGDERAFYYGHSFCGNPLGAAVALEVLRVYEDERVLERARPKAARIARRLRGARPPARASRAAAPLGMIGALDLAGGSGYLEPRGLAGVRRGARAGRLPAAARERRLRRAAAEHPRRRPRRAARDRARQRRRGPRVDSPRCSAAPRPAGSPWLPAPARRASPRARPAPRLRGSRASPARSRCPRPRKRPGRRAPPRTPRPRRSLPRPRSAASRSRVRACPSSTSSRAGRRRARSRRSTRRASSRSRRRPGSSPRARCSGSRAAARPTSTRCT